MITNEAKVMTLVNKELIYSLSLFLSLFIYTVTFLFIDSKSRYIVKEVMNYKNFLILIE